MSKFLKLIVNLMILCIAAVALALLVPPLAGVKTIMIDDSGKETNLPLGSVTYGQYVDVGELKQDDKILVESGTSTYEYKIKGMDEAAGTYILTDAHSDSVEEHTAELGGSVAVTLFTVPYIAYAAMAMQSVEGLIIAGLLIVFMIILFILSELWKKDDEYEEDDEKDEDEEDEEDEDDRPMTRKEKKRAKKEAKLAAKEAKREAKAAKKRAKKGYIEELEDDEEDISEDIAEDILEDISGVIDVKGDEQEEPLADSIELAMKESMAAVAVSIAATMQEQDGVTADVTKEFPEIKEEEVQETAEQEAVQEEKTLDDMEIIAMREEILPSLTVNELIAKATVNGEEPEIIEDEEAGVTLLDYSKLI